MGFWDWLKGTEPMFKGEYEYFPKVPEAEYEYYEPPHIPSWEVEPLPSPYEISPIIPHVPQAPYDYPVTAPDWFGSLVGAFKEAGQMVLKAPIWKKDSLQASYRIGTPGYDIDKPDPKDARLFTPYPRQDTGTKPAPISIAPSGGISPMILLVGIGAIVLLMMKGK